MKRYVYSEGLGHLIRIEEAVPVCGVDFCDTCGDCLVCYGEDPCHFGGEHQWVVYEEPIDGLKREWAEFRADLAHAVTDLKAAWE